MYIIDEKIEEIALKAEKSDKRLEDFDSYEEYKKYLDDIELDSKDFEKLNSRTDISERTILQLAKLEAEKGGKAKEFLYKCKNNGVKLDLGAIFDGILSFKDEDNLKSLFIDATL